MRGGTRPEHLLQDASIGIHLRGEQQRVLCIFQVEVMSLNSIPATNIILRLHGQPMQSGAHIIATLPEGKTVQVSVKNCLPEYTMFPEYRRIVKLLFFQAEDGIRDVAVTGVQTCALPISSKSEAYLSSGQPDLALDWAKRSNQIDPDFDGAYRTLVDTYQQIGDMDQMLEYFRQRSEERRVGKECRSRWSPYH